MSSPVEPIAIVGMGCRFPGGSGLEKFWTLLAEGRAAIGSVPRDRWDAEALRRSGAPAASAEFGAFLDDVSGFDWRALRIGPREGCAMDPQHRLALEVAWEALEDAGLPLEKVAGTRTAVFMGVFWGDYQRLQTRSWAHLDGYTAAGTPFAFAANRISHAFDLRGPSFAIDATCSSSLTAVSQACNALWSGQATLALAGGVNLMLAPETTRVMSLAGMLSPSGACRALDAKADGFVRGEGAGIVVLMPASQVRPGDRVYAWIRGVGLNHNGRNEWIMAPSSEGQARAVTEACERAGMDPATIDYVELHGSGFSNGDVVETRALGMALGAGGRRERPCVIGSVKTNIGNLDAASGIASLIKVALSLHHGQIPATLNLGTPNPRIEFDAWGLRPARSLMSWPTAGVRRAGVNTTSLSGVNAHVVLESAAQASERPPRSEAERILLPLSARTREALSALAAKVASWLREPNRPALTDVAYTASLRRSHHEHRLAAVGDATAIAQALAAFAAGEISSNLYCAEPSRSASGAAESSELEQAAKQYAAGGEVDWTRLVPECGRCVSLPTYAWQRERLWPSWFDAADMVSGADTAADVAAAAATPGESEARGAGFRDELLGLPLAEARARLVRYVQTLLRAALGLASDAPVAADQPLFDLGVVSLTAVELRNRFRIDLGAALPSSVLFEHPTVDRLAAHLLALVHPLASEAADRRSELAGALDRQLEVSLLSEYEAERRLLAHCAGLEKRMAQ